MAKKKFDRYELSDAIDELKSVASTDAEPQKTNGGKSPKLEDFSNKGEK